MYIQGYLVPVPENNKAAYKALSEKFWAIAKDYQALSMVEAWEADIPDGKVTDFRRAVNIEAGEKVVFSWMIWPDKATADAGQEKMMADKRMQDFGANMPFDGKRMVLGGFEPLLMRSAD